MTNTNVQAIEKTKDDFSEDLFFQIRDRTFEAVRRIAEQIQVGMLEEDANQMAIATLQTMGTRQGWHKPYVRFGPNTIKTFGADSDPGIRLGEDDIYFIDIGPVWEKYEGDAGETFITGNNPDHQRCSQDVKQIFQVVADEWKRSQLSGEALYQLATQTAQAMGWELNLDLSGHRLGDFPHDVHYEGGLTAIPFCPSPKLWVLEIQIRHPQQPFGAFYEDLLV
jgi:Xaa-Pro aminopeptidase